MGKSFSTILNRNYQKDNRSTASSGSSRKAFFFLHRTWAVILTDKRSKGRTFRSSKSDYGSEYDTYTMCSCRQCHRKKKFDSDWESEILGSEDAMAPNSENGREIRVYPWEEDILLKDKQRPPVYNAEDYALSVRKWTKKTANGNANLYTSSSTTDLDCTRSQSNNSKDYRNPMLTSVGSEMTLRQFGTVSELLIKLRADLRLAYPSFVQEFVSDPYDGVTLLLELLRNIQLSQNGHSGGTTSSSIGSALARTPPIVQRRALLDELACLQCLLCCCVRYHDAVHSLIASTAGLYTLAVCIMSSVNKSRIIALQLLTKACEASSKGHSAVSEAMTTLRLRYGEPVRFRFLVGMLTSAGGQGDLLAAGMRFINAFLDSAGSTQRRLYVQAELEQAGFDIAIIKKIIPINSPSTEHVFKEFDRWEKNHIDIETMTIRLENAEKDNDNLRDKVILLERRIQILQEEKGILLSLEQCLKERCSELEKELKSLKPEKTYLIKNDCSFYGKDRSTPADDEGISSSERSLTPEDEMRNETSVCSNYNQNASTIPKDKHSEYHNSDEEETTIEEVIEELQNIVNNEESNNYIEANKSKLILSNNDHNISRINSMILDPVIFDDEIEIIPTNLHPHPPRRVKSLVQMFLPADDYGYNQDNVYMDNGTPFTSEEGSDSLLSASKCHPQRVGSTTNCKNTTIIKLNSSETPNDQKIYDQIYSPSYEPIGKPSPQTFGIFFNSVKSLNDNFHHDFAAASTTLSKQTKKRLMTARQRAVNKIKSKSLDRIEDGLDAMVDIIVTDRKLSLQKDLQNELAASHSPFIKGSPGSQKSEETCKVILPKDQSQYFPQVNEKCSNNGSFVVKRGYNNVGLYSSCNLTKTTLSVPAPPKIETYCHKKINRLHSVSKLADLPSGLY